MRAPVLCIFARAPVRGHVKRRLAAEIGVDQALEAHRVLVEDTLVRLARVAGVKVELWLDDAAHTAGRVWGSRFGLEVRQQQGDDLGARMHRALLECLDYGGPGLVVGTDCPPVDAGYVLQAVAALATHDLVLGPAADGGYGLVGARVPAPDVFRGIAWGTAAVLRETLSAAGRAGFTTATLPEIWDVDTAADWRRYLAYRGR